MLEAIDWVAEAGAFPTVRIVRPASVILEAGIPTPQDLRRLMRHVYLACRRHWLPIGAAPNRESSVVVDPDDAVLLASATPASTATKPSACGEGWLARRPGGSGCGPRSGRTRRIGMD